MRIRDWSSYVCSSDLLVRLAGIEEPRLDRPRQLDRQRLAPPIDLLAQRDAHPAFGHRIFLDVGAFGALEADADAAFEPGLVEMTSEERRGGKAWVSTGRSWGSPFNETQKHYNT